MEYITNYRVPVKTYNEEGSSANSPVNGIKLSFHEDTTLIVKQLNATELAKVYHATVTFSHGGKKYKISPSGEITARKKKKGKPETKDKLYHRIVGLTKRLKDWETRR